MAKLFFSSKTHANTQEHIAYLYAQPRQWYEFVYHKLWFDWIEMKISETGSDVVRMTNVFLLIKPRTWFKRVRLFFCNSFNWMAGSSVFTSNQCERARVYEICIVTLFYHFQTRCACVQCKIQQCVGILMGCDISQLNTNELRIKSNR